MVEKPNPTSSTTLNNLVIHKSLKKGEVQPSNCPNCESSEFVEFDIYTTDKTVLWFCGSCREQFSKDDSSLDLWNSVSERTFKNIAMRLSN